MSKTRKILDRIEQATPGWVFTPSDMFDLASAHLVGMVLPRLVRAGRIRRLRRGLCKIQLRRRSPRRMCGVAESSARVISGLRSLGAGKVENAQIELLRGLLTRDERSLLLVDLRRAPRWMHRYLRAIAQGDVRGDGQGGADQSGQLPSGAKSVGRRAF